MCSLLTFAILVAGRIDKPVGTKEGIIDDMMNRGLEVDRGDPSIIRPTLGYLIKVRLSKIRTLAGTTKGPKTQDMEELDIYRLSRGTTVADALDPNNIMQSTGVTSLEAQKY